MTVLELFATPARAGIVAAHVGELIRQTLGFLLRLLLAKRFLTREDVFELDGYLKLETWPGPRFSRVRVSYDPARTDPGAIREALVMPVYEELQNFERQSPFEIQGYEPWAEE